MAIYFVSPSGSDNNDGHSPLTALKTIPHINTVMKDGDTCLFERGGTYYGQIRPPRNATYASYGDGDKPVISQLKRIHADAWEKVSDTLYRVDISNTANMDGNVSEPDTDVGYIKVNDIIHYRRFFSGKAPSLSASAGNENKKEDRYFDGRMPDEEYGFACLDNFLYVCCGQPGDDIWAACDIHCVFFNDGLTLRDLSFRGTGGHGVCYPVNGAYICNCDFIDIGGSVLRSYPQPNVRYGNGIECWCDSRDVLVENCYFSGIYDVGVTMQGGDDLKFGWENIVFRNNLFEHNTQCFEIWSKGKLPGTGFKNCRFENNVCLDSGYCWGYAARPNKSCSCHLLLYNLECPLCDITVTGNTFGVSRTAPIYKSGGAARMPDGYRIFGNTFREPVGGFIGGGEQTGDAYEAFCARLKKENTVTD